MKPETSAHTIFNNALELPDAAERARYLKEVCGADTALNDEVEKLLRFHEEAGGFFSQPLRPAAPQQLVAAIDLPGIEKAGDTIGRYKLLEQIGEGGCGVVYMAQQQEPVRRRVALKVIKLGMDTKQVVGRFEAERQALALMDHPNIARVLDAGATNSGRPFFVMELVRGLKLTEFCDQKKLSTRERLDLFSRVCQAVQHAHQKGIIHRDLKPSNILVTIVDGLPMPKVIDFGIAKATNNQALTDRTIFTSFEQFIGTPAYMSPEQAEMSGVDIDTRTDIYSLGVLLYELLTGRTPFDQKELLAAGLDAMRRIIREEEPPRPSTRLSTLEGSALTSTAQDRHTEAPKLVHLVRGDLDWIVMKCLEKDRGRRYETANALATDIRRHLDSEPVVARPPSRWYEFQKTFKRHKFGFAAGGALILVLAAGVVASAWQAVRATRAERQQSLLRREAQQSATLAEENASEAQKQRQQAEALAEENRVNLYAARIKLIAQTIDEGDVSHAQELLESLRPSKGQEDLRSFDWFYLHHLASSERSLTRTGGRVRSVAFSPDGQLMAAAGADRVVRLWDAKTQQLRGQLNGHTGEVAAVAFAPDGATLASAGADGSVRFWNVATGESLHTLQASSNSLAVMAFSPDGNWLAVGEGELAKSGTPFTRYVRSQGVGRVLVWNMKTLQLERSLDAHCCGVLSLTFSPDGKQLATGGGVDRTLKLFHVQSAEPLLVQTNFSGPVFALMFLPDREIAAASWNPYSESGRITIFEASTLEQKRVMLFAGKVTCLALSPDGRTLASAGPDRVLRLRDVVTGEETAVFHGHKAEIWSVAYSPDGNTVATGGFDDSIRLWNAAGHPATQRLPTRESFSVAFSPDGKLLACSSRTVEIYDAATGTLLRALPGYTNGNVRVAFSPDGSTLAATATDDGHTVQFWDVATWKHWSPQKSDLPVLPVSENFPTESQLAFSPGGTTLARGGEDGSVRLYNARTGALIGKLDESASSLGFTSLGFTSDGTRLISAYGKELRVWNMLTKQVESRARESGSRLRISEDGQWIACGGKGGVSIRQLPDLKVVRTLRGHRETVWGLNFSHDGRILATASWDGTVKLWQVATGEELFTIPSHSGVVWSVAFSPDDRSLAFGAGGSWMEGDGVTILRCASAERVAGKTRARELYVKKSLVQTCDEFGAAGNWKAALTNVNELLRFDPANDFHHYRLALLLVAVDDLEGYRQAMQTIQTLFAGLKDPALGGRMATACLVLPGLGADLGTASGWVDAALSRKIDQWSQFPKGLLEYRQGNFQVATQWMERVVAKEIAPALKAESWMVLAMARWRLHQPDAARAALAGGTEIIEQQLQKPSSNLPYAQTDYWSLWIGAHALHREASLLIKGKSPPDPFKISPETQLEARKP